MLRLLKIYCVGNSCHYLNLTHFQSYQHGMLKFTTSYHEGIINLRPCLWHARIIATPCCSFTLYLYTWTLGENYDHKFSSYCMQLDLIIFLPPCWCYMLTVLFLPWLSCMPCVNICLKRTHDADGLVA